MVYVTGDMHGDYALFSQKKFKNIKEQGQYISSYEGTDFLK